MIRTGDEIVNVVTGERLVFHATSADTDGEYVLVEAFLQPGATVAAAHVHPKQKERFEVLAGTVGFWCGREEVIAGPGDRITVPAGIAHKFWNAGEDEARFMCEVRPALGFERLLATMFALARDGKVNRKGMPNKLRLAVIANHHREDVLLPFPPAWMQRAALAMGAPFGRMLGFKATYDGTEPIAAPSAQHPAFAG
jgi:mannose-6-phosphate isomerase-like protein (cupin superfamily)